MAVWPGSARWWEDAAGRDDSSCSSSSPRRSVAAWAAPSPPVRRAARAAARDAHRRLKLSIALGETGRLRAILRRCLSLAHHLWRTTRGAVLAHNQPMAESPGQPVAASLLLETKLYIPKWRPGSVPRAPGPTLARRGEAQADAGLRAARLRQDDAARRVAGRGSR